MHARLVFEGGDSALALKELRAAAGTVVDRTVCFEKLADLGELAKSEDAVTYALDRLAHAGCADDSECVRNLESVARREAARGNERSAFAALKRAHERAPTDDGLLEQIARMAAKLDRHAESLQAYQTLALRHPDDGKWPVAMAAERLALVKSAGPSAPPP
jgi:tetratricopeptide (TPR) repeat protein